MAQAHERPRPFSPTVIYSILRRWESVMRQSFGLGCLVVMLGFIWGCSTEPSVDVALETQTATPSPTVALPAGPQRSPSTPNPSRPDNIDLTNPGDFQRGFTEATIIDTTRFEPQIRFRDPFIGKIRSTSELRPAEQDLPVLERGLANTLAAGSLIGKDRVATASHFPGISQTQWTPPDPSLAVGPNHIVQTVNQTVAFYDKQGGLQFQQLLNDTNEPGFFDEVGAGDFVFDPKCFYDHYANRFFIVTCEVYDDIDESYITIAISDDDDPNGLWFKYRTFSVIQIGAGLYWVDYPGLGFDESGIYVTANLFLLAGEGGFGNVLFRSFDKTPLLTGDAAAFTDIRNPDASSVQVAQHFGDNPAPYFVSRNNSTRLRIIALNDPFGSPSFTTEFVTVPEYFTPPGVPNGEPGNFLSTVGSRIMNVHWRDGNLWTCHSISNAAGNGSVARWYQVETGTWPNNGTPNLVQSGNVDVGNGLSTFFPAIYTDNGGNAALVMAQSGSGVFAGVAATGRLASDPLGTMGNAVLFDQGTVSANGRWGDYFDIALDPNDGRTFWMTGEFQTGNGWQTTLDSFALVSLGDLNNDGVVDLLDVEPFVQLIVTAGFDPAADINGDGVVDLLDVEPFVQLLLG